MVQDKDNTVQMYTNCFDTYIEEVKNYVRDLKKREWYVQGLLSLYREKVIAQCPKHT
ncbi:17530_t:CDS:1, partial [Racocetra persica]